MLQGASIPLNTEDETDMLVRKGRKQLQTEAAYSPQERRRYLYTVGPKLISAYGCPCKMYLCVIQRITDYEYFHALACILLTFVTPRQSKLYGTFELTTRLKKTVSTDAAFVRNCIETVTPQTVTPIKHGPKVKGQITTYTPIYDDS